MPCFLRTFRDLLNIQEQIDKHLKSQRTRLIRCRIVWALQERQQRKIHLELQRRVYSPLNLWCCFGRKSTSTSDSLRLAEQQRISCSLRFHSRPYQSHYL